MSDREEIIKGYDPQIVGRLVGYLKPYAGFVAAALAALLIATGAELLLPVVLQRTIDRHVTVQYRRIAADAAVREDGPFADVEGIDEAPVVDEWVYVPDDAFKPLASGEIGRLEGKGLIDPEKWYLFPLSDDLRYILQLKSGLFEVGATHGALRTIDLARLSREEKRTLRSHDVAGVVAATWRVLGLLLGMLVFSFAQVYIMAYTGQSVMKRLRVQLFGHTLGLKSGYLQHHPVGGLVTRITNDVETLNELFTNVATSLVKDVVMIGGVIVTMMLLDFRLSLVTLATVPPIVIATVIFRTRARDAFRRVRRAVSRVNAFLSERISGMSIVQIFAAEIRSAREFGRRSQELLDANLKEVRVFALFRPFVDLFTSVSIGVVLFYGAAQNLKEIVSLGVLIAFINLIRKFYRPIQDISEKFTVLQSAMAGGERVFDLLDTDERIPDTAGGEPDAPRDSGAIGAIGSIRWCNVVFGYDPADPVIRDVSFSISPGERIAVVGYTGAGKTTIINLLTRLWDIQDGTIEIDGRDVRDYPLAELRSMIQPVQQDVFLFAGTIADNISLGRDISRDRIVAAAEAVHALPFIERLTHGFDTEVREAGANLSTGQRQLISFARVLVGDPGIVVLDEATSSVDTETEQLIQSGLMTLLAGRTSITIAHRLSTIRESDRILVLSKGRLVESGSHEALLERDGTYATLYRLQYAETQGD